MSVIMHGNHYSIVFLNSWDVSGAMENVWNEDFIFTEPPPSEWDVTVQGSGVYAVYFYLYTALNRQYRTAVTLLPLSAYK